MNNGEMARIYFKDGKETMGLLLNDVNDPDAFEKGVHFVPHNHVGSWLDSHSDTFVEVLETSVVDGIDLFMK